MEKRNAGTVTVQVEHGKKLQAKGNERNVYCAGEKGSIAVSIVMEQVGFE